VKGVRVSQQADDVARSTVDCINQERLDGLRALCADQIQGELSTQLRIVRPTPTIGADALIDAIHAWKTAFPDLALDVIGTHGDEGTVTMELTFKGKHDGPLSWGEEVLAPTGRRVSTEFAQVVEVESGKAVAIRLYLDANHIYKQVTGDDGEA
jgi:predicted ester cyclase